jgi:hypothetical protein
MNPIQVENEHARLLFEMQKRVQMARLEGRRDEAIRLEQELTRKIHELFPETVGRKVRYDVSSKKVFIWG